MHRRERSTTLLHWLAAMALPLALIAALLPTARPASAAQQSGTALTWQVYTCPTDYAGTDYLANCTPGGASYDIALTDTSGTVVQQGSTDASGYVTFTGLAGDITSTLGVPGDFAHFYLACFDTTSGSEVFLFDGTGNQVTETFSGDAGSSVSCRWYVIPENASGLTPTPSTAPANGSAAVQVYLCPTDYAGTDYLADCDPSADAIAVSLNDGDTSDPATAVTADTGAEGRVSFAALSTGDYTLTLGVPGDFAHFYHACFDTTSGSEVFLNDGDTNLLTFSLAEDASISCRWYIIPEDLRGGSPSPTAAPSSQPTTAASASAKPSSVVALPNTGSGSGGSGSAPLTGLVAMLVAVAALIASALFVIGRRPGATR